MRHWKSRVKANGFVRAMTLNPSTGQPLALESSPNYLIRLK